MDWKNKEFLEEQYLTKKKSFRQIADLVGVSSPTVRKYTKQFGIKPRTDSESHKIEWDWDTFDNLNDLYNNQLLSAKQISEKYHVSPKAIMVRLNSHNIKLRDRIKARKLRFESHHDGLDKSIWYNYSWLNNQYKEHDRSIIDICKIVGYSYNYVRKALIKFGIDLRSNSEAAKMSSSATSERMVQTWKDSEYKNRIRKFQIKNAKIMWSDPEYQRKQSEISKELWKDSSYREKIIDSMIKTWAALELRQKSAITSEMLWNNSDYYKKTVSAIIEALSCPDIRLKISKGQKTIWEDPEYRQKQSDIKKELWEDPEYRQKIIQALNRPEVKEKLAIARAKQLNGLPSSIEKITYDTLDSLGIDYQPEHRIGFYVFDVFIPSHKILIECQGEYWHSLKRAVENDKSKATYIKKYFQDHRLIYLYEREFLSKDRIIERLKNELGVDEKINFNLDDVSFGPCPIDEAKEFINHYHYLHRFGGASHSYGAYLNDNLIAACVFGPVIRKEIATSLDETSKTCKMLTRFCIKPGYNKKNLATWIISRALKKFSIDNPEANCVTTFSDSTFGHDGTIYKAGNWSFVHRSPPDYWYCDPDGYVMHKKTLYSHAQKSKIKESEYADKHDYRKVYGGEKSKWVYYFDRH